MFEPILLEIPKLFLTGPSFERLFTIRLLPRLFTEVNSHILQLIGKQRPTKNGLKIVELPILVMLVLGVGEHFA